MHEKLETYFQTKSEISADTLNLYFRANGLRGNIKITTLDILARYVGNYKDYDDFKYQIEIEHIKKSTIIHSVPKNNTKGPIEAGIPAIVMLTEDDTVQFIESSTQETQISMQPIIDTQVQASIQDTIAASHYLQWKRRWIQLFMFLLIAGVCIGTYLHQLFDMLLVLGVFGGSVYFILKDVRKKN